MFNSKRGDFQNANDIINPYDLKRTIVVIDTRFRDSPTTTPPTEFIMKMMKPYKNIVRVRLTSTEFPNVFYTFSEKMHNVRFTIFYDVTDEGGNVTRYPFTAQIKTGNYTAEGLRGELQTKLDQIAIEVTNTPDVPASPSFIMEIDDITGRYTVYDNAATPTPFGVDFTEPALITRTHNWGLGYYMGYRYRVLEPAVEHEAESFMDTNGHPHLYLALNDYVSCELNNHINNIECFAVIIQKENKYFSIFGDEASMLTREVVFAQPRDISQFKVRLFDVYGNTVDMEDTDWSFTLEVTEVMNPRIYQFYKDYQRLE